MYMSGAYDATLQAKCVSLVGYTENLENMFDGTNDNIGEIAIGFYSSMWAYDGW